MEIDSFSIHLEYVQLVIQCYGIEEREERANPPVQTDICKCTHFQPITSTCFNRNVGVGIF